MEEACKEGEEKRDIGPVRNLALRKKKSRRIRARYLAKLGRCVGIIAYTIDPYLESVLLIIRKIEERSEG